LLTWLIQSFPLVGVLTNNLGRLRIFFDAWRPVGEDTNKGENMKKIRGNGQCDSFLGKGGGLLAIQVTTRRTNPSLPLRKPTAPLPEEGIIKSTPNEAQ
jgi:hypothetical protein